MQESQLSYVLLMHVVVANSIVVVKRQQNFLLAGRYPDNEILGQLGSITKNTGSWVEVVI